MLVLQSFGLPVVENALPTLTGFGAYSEGSCKEGKDFLCNVKDGLFSCRPCDFPQLAKFKLLQDLANRLATAFGIGRDKLAETDGRIATVTARLIGLVGRQLAVNLPAPSVVSAALAAAQEAPSAQETFRTIAKVVPELVDWFTAGVGFVGAPTSYPTPPKLPRAEPSGDSPVNIPDGETPTLPPYRSKLRTAGIAVGVLGLLTAAALVGVAHYSKKGRRLR